MPHCCNIPKLLAFETLLFVTCNLVIKTSQIVCSVSSQIVIFFVRKIIVFPFFVL